VTVAVDHSKYRVLFLDDEYFNLQSFKAAFRQYFDVFIALNPGEALEILDTEDIEVIISDQRMPEKTGTEFFEEIRKSHPYPVRILLTGYVDIKAVIDAINKGQVFRFLTKPWNEEEVKITINNAGEIFRTRRELDSKNQMLEKAYKHLDQFVYSASHDLRSPIASLKGLIQLINLEPENMHEYVNMIGQIVEKMDKYVINVIHYYRSSRFEKQIQIVNLESIVRDLLEEFHFMPEAKGVHIFSKFNITSAVYSDEVKLYLILRNLIHNAIKFQRIDCEEKQVEIQISADSEQILLKISDNGVGMSEDETKELFEMFKKGTNIKSGTGLGLYIVNQCIQQLGGEITYDTTSNIGTVFDILIPNHKEDAN
jgi:two-component system, sensor histidine kinase and response regulator